MLRFSCKKQLLSSLEGESLKKKDHLFCSPPWNAPGSYTAGGFVWCDRPIYLVKLYQEKWACDFHDDAPPLSFQLQVTEIIF